MKILWFTDTPTSYGNAPIFYNGRGWIESLEQTIKDVKSIELAIGFYYPDKVFKRRVGNTLYYPISLYDTMLRRIWRNFFYSKADVAEVEWYDRIISDFKPDVIHVFGSEPSFGLVTRSKNIPTIIHIQGILNPCLNAFYPPNYSLFEQLKLHFFKPIDVFNILRNWSFFKHHTKRELEILSSCKYFMGRTLWDKDVLSLYAPESQYFYCSEVLRDIFYNMPSWRVQNRSKLILVSTISKKLYKGFDLILKTASLLKGITGINFEWQVFGIDEYTELEKKLNISSNKVNVVFKGIGSAEVIANAILDSNIFIHPSYIDNSPNSICEAQILGAPVISTNVGGISSLIENNKTGFLVPSNDPYSLAARIVEISKDPVMADRVGKNAKKIAMLRHNRAKVKADLLNIYQELSAKKLK